MQKHHLTWWGKGHYLLGDGVPFALVHFSSSRPAEYFIFVICLAHSLLV